MLNKLAIGTVQFGLNYGIANKSGQVSAEEGKLILDFARSNGVDTLDTAIGYGDSEKVLGQIGVSFWNVITKLPAIPDSVNSVSAWVNKSFAESLEKLGRDKLYGLLLHRPADLLSEKGEELYQILLSLKRAGVVQKIGISIYEPSELDLLLKNFDFDLIQAPMNVLDRRLISSGWLERLKQKGIEIHIRSTFLQGLLLMNKEERPSKFNRWSHLWKTWDEFLRHSDLTPLAASLGFVLQNPSVDKLVVGVDSLSHIKEIISCDSNLTFNFPNELECNDVELLNPAMWKDLS